MSAEILHQLPALVVIMFLASVVQGATGFGFGLFAVAALSLFVPLQTSTPLLAILNTPVIFYVLYKLRRSIVWRGMGPIIAGMAVGIPFGIFILVNWPQDLLMRVLGVVLLLAAARSLKATNGDDCEVQPRQSLSDHGLGLFVGLTTGALAGAFNTGGPPIIAYVYCQPWTKEQRTATLQAVFAISVVWRLVVMACSGLYNAPLLITAAVCLPAAFLGMPIGYAVYRRIHPRTLEIVVALFLVAIAIKLLVWA